MKITRTFMLNSFSTFFLVFLLFLTSLNSVVACRVKIGVYWDFNCEDPVELIDWGPLQPGSNRSFIIYIRNEGDISITLSLDTEDWSPELYSEYLSLIWNYTGETMSRDSILCLELNLLVDLNIEPLDGYTFSIIINAQNGVSSYEEIESIGFVLWFTVHNLDTGLSYPTIQVAIDAGETMNGHTIFVEDGTYYENVVVYKPLLLQGENESATIIDGDGSGIVLSLTSDNCIVGNFTIRNGEYGLSLSNSMGCEILDNSISNSSIGIFLVNSSNNRFKRNLVINNSNYSVLLHNSSDNHLYHNNYVNNTQQVFDEGLSDPAIPVSLNIWFQPYPFGGAYWSDYAGEDDYGGPYQNETWSDNVGDTPYIVDANNVDEYPLMGPFGPFTMIGENSTVFPNSNVSLTFGNITAEGFTTVETTDVGPGLPSGFELLGEYYDIQTTVDYSGLIMIRIVYDDSNLTEVEETTLALLHWNETSGEWADITTRVDTESNVIYGETTRLSVFGVTASRVLVEHLDVTIEIYPHVMNLVSKGDWILVYIELPENYTLTDIDTSSLALNDTIYADLSVLPQIDDFDNDTIMDLAVAFNRTEIVESIVNNSVTFGNVTLILTGELQESILFKGNDTIIVSGLAGDVNCDGRVSIHDIVEACAICNGETDQYLSSNANFAPPWIKVDIFDIVTIAYHYGETY